MKGKKRVEFFTKLIVYGLADAFLVYALFQFCHFYLAEFAIFWLSSCSCYWRYDAVS